MITIVDYGAGNLRSVENTLSELGASFERTNSPDMVAAATKLILPGVGHIGQMMHALDTLHLRDAIVSRAQAGVPLLGICLGMQAMFDGSDEAPEAHGLGLFPGRVQRFPAHARVPHMGWNELALARPSRLLANLGPHPFVYFANSYYCPSGDVIAATAHYEFDFAAALENDHVFGVQFHPEKSGPVGLKIIRNFLELV